MFQFLASLFFPLQINVDPFVSVLQDFGVPQDLLDEMERGMLTWVRMPNDDNWRIQGEEIGYPERRIRMMREETGTCCNIACNATNGIYSYIRTVFSGEWSSSCQTALQIEERNLLVWNK